MRGFWVFSRNLIFYELVAELAARIFISRGSKNKAGQYEKRPKLFAKKDFCT